MMYRRTQAQMSGYAHELDAARQDGVRLLENCQPAEILRKDGQVVGVKTVAGEVVPAQLVAVAIGQAKAIEAARAFPGVALDARGCITVDPKTHRTGNPKVWSGGDCVNGGKEVVNAVAEAKLAVKDIHAALTEGR